MSKDSTDTNFTYCGGCHCQSVRFSISIQKPIEETKIILCNCSMCDKFGYLHLILPKNDVSFDTSFSQLTNYQFNTKTAKHYFCKTCGVKSFYQPRSHPDCWSVNARCLDDFSNSKFIIETFDGKNWEDNITKIS